MQITPASPRQSKVVYTAPATGATTTLPAAEMAHLKLYINPSATIATHTVVLPTTPFDGQVVKIATSQIITALTITGTIVGTLTTLALGGFASFEWSADSSKWFRTG